MLAIGLAKALDPDGGLAGMGGGRKAEVYFFHPLGNDDRNNLLELLDPALHQCGLRSLVTETPDEVLQPLDLLLLPLPGDEGGVQFLCAPGLVGRVAAGVTRASIKRKK